VQRLSRRSLLCSWLLKMRELSRGILCVIVG
jgi:hypothetical protein